MAMSGVVSGGMMKAFVMKKAGETGIVDKPIPKCGPNDVLVKTTAALVCTTDTHTAKGSSGERHNLTLGHEAVGIVEQVGSEVHDVKKGDRVITSATTPCFKCDNCQRGRQGQCKEILGSWNIANKLDGTLAEYYIINNANANCTIVPHSITDEQACYCTDMMSTGLAGVERCHIPVGGSCLVSGCGPVGLCAVAMARLSGCALVIAADYISKRLNIAKEYGADVVIDLNNKDVVKEVMSHTNNSGVDGAVECVGSEISFTNCLKCTRPGGTVCNVGAHIDTDHVKLPISAWGSGMSDHVIEAAICPGGRYRMKNMMSLIESKRFDPCKLTTHHMKFNDIQKAFDMVANNSDGVIKPLITFH